MADKKGYFVGNAGMGGKEKNPEPPPATTPTDEKDKKTGRTVDIETLPKYLGEGGGSNW